MPACEGRNCSCMKLNGYNIGFQTGVGFIPTWHFLLQNYLAKKGINNIPFRKVQNLLPLAQKHKTVFTQAASWEITF